METIIMDNPAQASRSVPAFLGFRRPRGRAGIRNVLLVLCINGLAGGAARRIAQGLPGSSLVSTPYGRGQLGPDKEAHFAQFVGLGSHPNVGAVLLVGADRPSAETVARAIDARAAKPVEIVTLDDVEEDAIALAEQGLRLGGSLARVISGARREPILCSDLFLGIECGHSDATSGLAANPLAGAVADILVDLGGTAVIGETMEWLGAEHILSRRAVDETVGQRIVAAVEEREAAVKALGVNLLFNNPGHENIRGGLSTIEEKSLGAIAKAGHRPIRSVLAFAAPPAQPGMHLMDGPSFSPESLTGFAAAGAQIMLFTTGPGNSFCSLLAPTIKISANPKARHRLAEQVDFDASGLLRGHTTLAEEAARVMDLVLAVASGSATWGEIYGEGAECFARMGTSF
jgi:altronate dehydratase large subunit